MAHPTGNNSPGNVLGHNDNANANTLLQPDLLDWLTLTGYHDVQYRTNSLSEYRQAKLQEEAVGFTPSTPHVANPATPQQDRTDHLPTGSHDASGNHAGLTDDFGPPVVGRRRSLSPQPRGPPNRHDFRSRDRFKRSDSEDRGRPRTPRGPPTGPGCARPRASGRPHSFSREKMDDSRDPRLELATLRPPRPMDLGPKGKVRFFVMRSYSWDHVYSSQADGLWATQPEKVGTLQKAFNEEDMTVVLFFAMNRSHSIQGYAIMRSGPSRAIRAPKWLREVRWNISDPFRVEWYNTITIDSDKVSHIMNRFNNFLSVTRSRNGQEINDGAGRDMLEILEACSQEQYRRAKETGTLPLF